jgi:hypothetical protein
VPFWSPSKVTLVPVCTRFDDGPVLGAGSMEATAPVTSDPIGATVHDASTVASRADAWTTGAGGGTSTGTGGTVGGGGVVVVEGATVVVGGPDVAGGFGADVGAAGGEVGGLGSVAALDGGVRPGRFGRYFSMRSTRPLASMTRASELAGSLTQTKPSFSNRSNRRAEPKSSAFASEPLARSMTVTSPVVKSGR